MYLALAAAAVLLAPYAGCHMLLTQAPEDISVDDADSEVHESTTAGRAPINLTGDEKTAPGSRSGTTKPSRGPGATDGTQDLRDIEDLLSR
jgi:hypothetical protein